MENKEIQIRMRKTNIELLRALTMAGVITLHYNNPSIGGGITFADGINLYILYFIESLCICAVDLFILINGYFMCKSNKRTLIKPLQLIVQVMTYSCATYLLRVLLGSVEFSVRSLLRSLVPNNYFVILYVTLYFISPYINILLEKLSIQQMKRMVAILVLLFSIWPTFVDASGEILGIEWIGLSSVGMYGSQWGYSIVNFILLYIVGAYIRYNEDRNQEIDESSRKQIIKILACTLILMIWAIINDYTGYFTERTAWEYCNPIMILQAVLIFRLFNHIVLRQSRIINEIARGSFTVFLLQNIFVVRLDVEKYVTSNLVIMLLHLTTSVILIYLICWIVYEIYERITSPVYKVLIHNAPILGENLTRDINT